MFGELRNSHNETLDYTYHESASPGKILAVLGHGVTGNKDRPFVIALAEGLTAGGIPALRFSFSGNGQSGGRFEDSTVSKEVEDLGSVLDAVGNRSIAYLGHSMGGAVGVLRASRDSRITKLVSLAGMVRTHDFAQREFGSVVPGQGFMWDKSECPLSSAYMDDMARIGSVLDRAADIAVPWLFVHGTEDDVVPIEESREMYARAGEPKRLIELPGADHVFSGDSTEAMVRSVVEWLRKD